MKNPRNKRGEEIKNMKKKYAFILLGKHYNPEKDKAKFETDGQITYIVTVRNMEEAFRKISSLVDLGVGAIELCGAFGEENAKKIIDETNNKIAIGYVVNRPEQDDLFASFFSDFG